MYNRGLLRYHFLSAGMLNRGILLYLEEFSLHEKNKSHEGRSQKEHGDEEAIESDVALADEVTTKGDGDDVGAGREDAAETLTLDHRTHVAWRKLARNTRQTSLRRRALAERKSFTLQYFPHLEDGHHDIDNDH